MFDHLARFSNNCRTQHSCNKLADLLLYTKKNKMRKPAWSTHAHPHTRYASLYLCVWTFKAYTPWAWLTIAERHPIFQMHTHTHTHTDTHTHTHAHTHIHTRSYTYARRTSYSCSEIPNYYSTRAIDISSRPVKKEKGKRACLTHARTAHTYHE